MAPKKISELSAAATLTGAEQVPVVQSGATVRTTAALLNAIPRAISTITGLAAELAAAVKLTGAQTIAGIKTFSSAPVVPDASFAIAKTTGLQTALDAKARTVDVGRRTVNAYNRYAGLANGAVPATAQSGHSWTHYGQTPAVSGGKKRNPTGATGPTYDALVLDGAFASMSVEWTIEPTGTLAGSSIAMLSSVNSGALLHDFLHMAVEAGVGWGLSYVVGTLSGGNPLTFLATGPFDSAALGGSYRMEVGVAGDLIYVRGPDGDITAVQSATGAALAGPRCTWEIIAPTGVAEARITAESAAVHDPAAVMAPPRDVYDLARWIAGHDSALVANRGNLIAKKDIAAHRVEIGRSTAFGVASILINDFEVFRAGAGIGRTLGRLGMDAGLGVGNRVAATTPGAVTGKTEIFDATTGASLGFLPIYGTIT